MCHSEGVSSQTEESSGDPSVDAVLPQDDTTSPMDIDIAKLEQLAKIRLTSEERAALSTQLPVILEYVAKLQEVNTDGVSSAAYISLHNTVWRDDCVEENEQERSAALALFPQTKAGALQVPSVGARTKKKFIEE